MDEKLLAPLGLNTSEASVYKAVLKSGGIAPSTLAKAAGIKRTTAYSIARGLVEKGLLTEDITRRPRVFVPATPEQVLLLVVEEKKRMDEREVTLKKFANELSKISAEKSYPVPTVRFVEEGKVEQFMYQQTPEWHKSMVEKDPTWWGFQDHTFVDHYLKWIDWHWEHAPKEIDVKLLSNRSEVEASLAGKYPKRGIKFWGEATNFISTTWICGDYVIMVNTRNRPFYLVEIHDKLLAHDHREVYKNLWPLV